VTDDAPTPKRSFWRRLRDPIVAQFSQGVTPDKIAATLAVGTACAFFPFLGFTALLTLGAGLVLRMNQPILQTLNQLLGPLQLVMILVYVRAGEWIWRAHENRFSVADMLRTFHDTSFGEFLQRFGWAGIHAFTAWLISVPVIIVGIYYPLRPVMIKLAALRAPKP
jgi:uncharacterized protein (DUF2062 family)